MSGVGEAALVTGLISSLITIVENAKSVWEAAKDEQGLPKNFKNSALRLPLVLKLLTDAKQFILNSNDESLTSAFKPVLEDCKTNATQLQILFDKVVPEADASRLDRYTKAARTIGKRGRVETIIKDVLSDLQLLAIRFPDVTSELDKGRLASAIELVDELEPSLPDGFEDSPSFAHYGSGSQNINTGGSQTNNNYNIGRDMYNGTANARPSPGP